MNRYTNTSISNVITGLVCAVVLTATCFMSVIGPSYAAAVTVAPADYTVIKA